MHRSTHNLSLVVALACVALLFLLGGLSRAMPAAGPLSSTWYVTPHGDDSHTCDTPTAPCRRVQAALDKAAPGDAIHVAQGVYTDPLGSVVQIDQEVTLLGGWDLSFTVQAPISYPAILDAQGGGPVATIRGPVGADPISPWIEGFALINGNGTGVTGCVAPNAGGCGGGIFGTNATPYILNNLIAANVATVSGEGYGGGIFLQGAVTGGLIEGNVIAGNQATLASTASIPGWGGGICLHETAATIYDNLIQANVASASQGWGYGGGVLLYRSAGQVISNVVAQNTASAVATGQLSGWGGGISVVQATSQAVIQGNQIRENIASVAGHGWGGGIQIGNSTVLIAENQIMSNTAGTAPDYRGDGGGIYGRYGSWTIRDNQIISNTSASIEQGFGGGCQLEYGYVVLERNVIAGNTASLGSRSGLGGGANLLHCDGSLVRGNTIRDNLASASGEGYGGGLSVRYGPITVEGNTILNNRATAGGLVFSWGGGVRIDSAAPVTLTNNVIAGNQARTEGGGVHVFGNAASSPAHAVLVHNTLVDNAQAAGGEGVFLAQYATAVLTNNLIVSHTYGVFGETGTSAATAYYTLFHANTVADTAGAVTASHTLTGPPHLSPDWHIGWASAALDSGATTFVTQDIDGDVRPIGVRADVGADEIGFKTFLPVLLRSGL